MYGVVLCILQSHMLTAENQNYPIEEICVKTHPPPISAVQVASAHVKQQASRVVTGRCVCVCVCVCDMHVMAVSCPLHGLQLD